MAIASSTIKINKNYGTKLYKILILYNWNWLKALDIYDTLITSRITNKIIKEPVAADAVLPSSFTSMSALWIMSETTRFVVEEIPDKLDFSVNTSVKPS